MYRSFPVLGRGLVENPVEPPAEEMSCPVLSPLPAMLLVTTVGVEGIRLAH